jgi:hypothetical protein
MTSSDHDKPDSPPRAGRGRPAGRTPSRAGSDGPYARPPLRGTPVRSVERGVAADYGTAISGRSRCRCCRGAHRGVTAHAGRLLLTLAQGFADRGREGTYRPGPQLRSRDADGMLRSTAYPHLRQLVARLAETAELIAPDGSQVRYLLALECARILRVSSREGRTAPAIASAGGRVILAHDLHGRMAAEHISVAELEQAQRALSAVRRDCVAFLDDRDVKRRRA